MADIERSYLGKVSRRILPLLFLGIMVGYLDRANISYAAIRMNVDMGLSPTVYGWAAGLFFIGYFCFEIPGTMALGRFGARSWMAFLVLCWGMISVLMALTHNVPTFFFLRFLLGASEAGFFPGTILYMNYWVPQAHRARLGGYFMTAVPIAMVFGGPISGLLMQWDGLHGLHGWQWMFLLEGAPCFILAIAFAALLIDHPQSAAWLTAEEKAFIARDKAIEEAGKTRVGSRGDWRDLLDLRLALLCTVTFGGPAVAMGVTFWLPQVMTGFGLSVLQTGFLSALPFAVAAIAMWLWGSHADRTGERKWHLVLPLVVAAVGLAGTVVVASPIAKFTLLLIASLGMFSYLPVAWASSHQLFKGRVSAIGYGVISMSGALAGFVAPTLLGWLRQTTGTHQSGILALVAIAVAAAIGGFAFGALMERRGADAAARSQPA